MSDAARRCVELLRRRVDAVPALYARLLDDARAFDLLAGAGAVVTTGVGASEGPARYLEALCWRHGPTAHFAPLSAVVSGAAARLGDTLVLFSQALSPNARLAVRRAAPFARVVLVTSLTTERAAGDAARCLDELAARGGRTVVVPTDDEAGLLVRVLGPSAAYLAVAAAVAGRTAAPFGAAMAAIPAATTAAATEARASARSLDDGKLARVAFVTAGELGDPYQGLRWRWLETLATPEPSGWDVLHVVHGAHQELMRHDATVIALEADRRGDSDLFDRLARVLDPTRHRLVRLTASLPRELALFELDAAVSELVLEVLGRRPRDLSAPDAPGLDAPLYGLDGRPDDATR